MFNFLIGINHVNLYYHYHLITIKGIYIALSSLILRRISRKDQTN